jgi:site-specific DNA-methyltransferase (adenine-specific)
MKVVKLYKGDCVDVMREFEGESIDLVVTSPPYDDLRSYNGTCEWNFDVFKQVANELYRVIRRGGGSSMGGW